MTIIVRAYLPHNSYIDYLLKTVSSCFTRSRQWVHKYLNILLYYSCLIPILSKGLLRSTAKSNVINTYTHIMTSTSYLMLTENSDASFYSHTVSSINWQINTACIMYSTWYLNKQPTGVKYRCVNTITLRMFYSQTSVYISHTEKVKVSKGHGQSLWLPVHFCNYK